MRVVSSTSGGGRVSACPGCGLANCDGFCPHCRGDLAEYEERLAPVFGSYVRDADPAPTEDGDSHREETEISAASS